jgi:hypothetical protein
MTFFRDKVRGAFIMIPKQDAGKLAFRFVLIIGVVNLFADMTYEGGRGITGPFLGSLGASASIVGFVAGFGELMGYSLRSISGYFADKTRRYWASFLRDTSSTCWLFLRLLLQGIGLLPLC